MSTPYNGGDFQPYPEHPEGSHPENGTGGQGNYGAQGGSTNYPQYTATTTPIKISPARATTPSR